MSSSFAQNSDDAVIPEAVNRLQRSRAVTFGLLLATKEVPRLGDDRRLRYLWETMEGLYQSVRHGLTYPLIIFSSSDDEISCVGRKHDARNHSHD